VTDLPLVAKLADQAHTSSSNGSRTEIRIERVILASTAPAIPAAFLVPRYTETGVAVAAPTHARSPTVGGILP